MSDKKIFQVWVGLDGVEPPVFRHLKIRDCTLATLHQVIQLAMPWRDIQLSFFEIEDRQYTTDRKAQDEFGWENANRMMLSQIWKAGSIEFAYIYDMSDRWEHSIVLEAEIEHEPRLSYPNCFDADRAAPPEDTGGVIQYERLLQAFGNRKDPKYEAARAKLGANFDPNFVSLDAINTQLKRIRN